VKAGDTSLDAFRAQVAVYRSMSPEQRVGIAMEMSRQAIAIAGAGIRARHSDYTDAEVEWALKRLRVGDELFRAAWPGAPVLDP